VAKRPWFSLYVADWAFATAGMTLEEQGAYMRLLTIQWVEGSISWEPRRVALKLGVPLDYYQRELSPMVETHFVRGEDGRLRNPRLERERDEAEALSQANSINGKKRAASSGRDSNGRYIESSDRSSESPATNPAPHQPSQSHSQSHVDITLTRATPLDQLWLAATGVMPGSNLLEAFDLARRAAPAKGLTPEEYFSKALGAFSTWVDGVRADRRPQKSPVKFIEHFARIQEILDGKREAVPAERPLPTRARGPLPPMPAATEDKTEVLPP
jgi:uncharacterized protein YdaU (DUF1376 family)